MRWQWLVGMLVAAAFGAGCEFLVTFETVPEGGGGNTTTSSGGTATATTQGTGGSSGTGAQSGTTSSSTTGTIDCNTENDCPNMGPCSTATCDSGTCAYAPLPSGTVVGDVDSTDCVQEACDGQGNVTSAPDDDDVPPQDGGECHDVVCSGGSAMIVPKNEGRPCSKPITDPCQQEAVCMSGDCTIVNYPDGDYSFGQCGTATCMNGTLVSAMLNDVACGPDPNPANCFAPDCKSDGSCGSQALLAGTVCDKAGGGPGDGVCDGAGNCL